MARLRLPSSRLRLPSLWLSPQPWRSHPRRSRPRHPRSCRGRYGGQFRLLLRRRLPLLRLRISTRVLFLRLSGLLQLSAGSLLPLSPAGPLLSSAGPLLSAGLLRVSVVASASLVAPGSKAGGLAPPAPEHDDERHAQLL